MTQGRVAGAPQKGHSTESASMRAPPCGLMSPSMIIEASPGSARAPSKGSLAGRSSSGSPLQSPEAPRATSLRPCSKSSGMVSLSDDGLKRKADPEADEAADAVPREIEVVLCCLASQSKR